MSKVGATPSGWTLPPRHSRSTMRESSFNCGTLLGKRGVFYLSFLFFFFFFLLLLPPLIPSPPSSFQLWDTAGQERCVDEFTLPPLYPSFLLLFLLLLLLILPFLPLPVHRFHNALTTVYFRRADAFVIVYDVTDRRSFQNTKSWLNIIEVVAMPWHTACTAWRPSLIARLLISREEEK